MTADQHEKDTEEHMEEHGSEDHGETITIEAEDDSAEGHDTDVAGDLRKLKTDMVISKHMAVSVGVGFIPLPVVDFAAITGVQLAVPVVPGLHSSRRRRRAASSAH